MSAIGSGPKVAAVVPSYNAERTVGRVVAGLASSCSLVVVVDDGSGDGTAEAAVRAGAQVVRHERNRGLGAALRTGFAAVLAHPCDIVVTLDSDGQHEPEDVSRVIERLVANHCDVVIGSRLLDRSQFRRFPPLRLVGNLMLTSMTNLAASRRVTSDSQSGYRAFRREVLERCRLTSDRMAISSEIVLEAAALGCRVVDVPIAATYGEEISYQRLFADPMAIAWLLLKRGVERRRPPVTPLAPDPVPAREEARAG